MGADRRRSNSLPVFLFPESRFPKDSNQPYRMKASPAHGGAEAIAALGRRWRKHSAKISFARLQGDTP